MLSKAGRSARLGRNVKKRVGPAIALLILTIVGAKLADDYAVGGKVVDTIVTEHQAFFVVDRDTGATDGFVTQIYSGPQWLGPHFFNLRATITSPSDAIKGEVADDGVTFRVTDDGRKAATRKVVCGDDLMTIMYSK